MNRYSKYIPYIIAITVIAIFFGWLIFSDQRQTSERVVSQIDTEEFLSGEWESFDQKARLETEEDIIEDFVLPEDTTLEKIANKFDVADIPKEKLLDVQFIPQAPFHDWNEPWQNACEEAVILGADNYINGNKVLSNEQIRDNLQAMVDFQKKEYGFSKDLTTAQMAKFVDDHWPEREIEIFDIRNIDDIKWYIAQDIPVILPVSGRILDNSNFTEPGPVYHTLLVIGYTVDKIITNDPGTQFGASFEYTYENLYNSIHDFVIGANENPSLMFNGKKVGVVIR